MTSSGATSAEPFGAPLLGDADVAPDLCAAEDARPIVQRRSSRAHASILAATVDLLAEVGFAGLSIEGVACRAGVGKATIYRHWSTKAELVIEAFTSLTRCNQPVRAGDLRTDLVECVSAIVAAVTSPPMGPILPSLLDAAERDPELAELHRQFTAQRRRFLLDVLASGIDQGVVKPGADVELVADLLVGPVLYRRLISRAPLGPDYAERLVDMVLPLLQPTQEAEPKAGRG